MRIKRYKSNDERSILTALIVHDGVLEKVSRHFDKDSRPFRSKWSNLVAGWCFDYFAKYQKAPRRSIEGLFNRYAQSTGDTEAADLVESFLAGLDHDHRQLAKEMNEAFMVDKASGYFDEVRLGRLAEQIQSAIEKKDLDEARQLQAAYKRVDFSSKAWIDPFSDESIHDTFHYDTEDKVVIHLPGDMDKFLSPSLERSGFVSFAGPDKRGKSWWLQEMVWQALKQHRRVLYYVLGDMSEHDVKQRLYCRLLRQPWKGRAVRVPTRIVKDGTSAEVRFKERNLEGVSPKAVRVAARKFNEMIAATEPRLRLRVAGGDVVAASDIEHDVKQCAKEGWVPDAVVVDYFDLLAAELATKRQDLRHQINATWMTARRIAIDHHCLVLGATQTSKTAYSARIIRKKDFSEDKRKNAHVTGMIGINQNDDEHEQGIYRLNWIVLRKGRWHESQVIWTAGCLDVGCPCVVSTL